jgi:hypothetical protein
MLLLAVLPLGLAGAAAFAACASEPTTLPRSPSKAPVASTRTSPESQTAAADRAGTVAAARRAAQQAQREQDDSAAPDEGTPEAVIARRMQHRRRKLLLDPTSSEKLTGPVVAVGPVDPQPAVGDYLHGAKFEPPLGRVLHGMGQWLAGNDSFLAAIDDPSLQPATQLLYLPIGDWPRSWEKRITATRLGMSDLVAQRYIPHLDISLYGLDAQDQQVGVDSEIANGNLYDGRVRDIARAVRSLEGPVFVRIGGEFNGSWSPYTAFDYPKAFRRIVELFRAEGVENAAFVWCYEPDGAGDFAEVDPVRGARWYPGDDVVDWFSVDVFQVDDFTGPLDRRGMDTSAGRCEAFLRMALEHDKPVIVAESSAAFVQITPDPADGEADWATWFEPYFQFLEANPNIEAFHYVNVDWSNAGEYGEKGWKDARIEVNPLILERFRAELRKPRYLHSGSNDLLNGATSLPPPVPAPPLEPATIAEPPPRRR